jgi:RluA family pseudouridine synthase
MDLPANIKIVFEDEHIIVVNKPAGLLVIPAHDEKYTLTSLLGAYPCHRLDRDTSGLIVYARTKQAHNEMLNAFRTRNVKKRYIGFVQGFLEKQSGMIKKRIEGKEALTYYRVLEENKRGFSVLEIHPLTGRTNQIRLHMKSIGHPLVGERKFSFGKDFSLKFRRPALQSQRIEFNHPVTKKRVWFSAGLPEDMKKFLYSRDSRGFPFFLF